MTTAHRTHRTRRTTTAFAAAALVALPLNACQQDDGAVDTGDAVERTDEDQTEPKAGLDPATLSFEDISDDLEAMVGEEVMVEAKVEDIEVDMPVVLTGTVHDFLTPNKVERLLDVQLEDELLSDYDGQPYIESQMIHEGAA